MKTESMLCELAQSENSDSFDNTGPITMCLDLHTGSKLFLTQTV